MSLFFPALTETFRQALAALPPGRIAVAGHARPDGDCIGAQVALARMLRATGREVICVNTDPVPRRLVFCLGDTPFIRAADLPEGQWISLYVDCADHARAGDRLKARFSAPFANIDHHLSNVGYAQYNLLDAGAAATCEILAGVFLDLGLAIDATSAQALFTGIVTDTGQFRFESTSERTFRLAAELMARGARPAAAGAELYERETAGKLQLLQRFLASLRIECGGRVCLGVLPRQIFEETGTNAEDTEGLVDYARSIEGVDVGVLIEERPDGLKASLRAKNAAYRVDRVAAQFNGGGHACAAGLNVRDISVETFTGQLVAALAERILEVDTKSAAR